ncbi:MAG: carboxymuconolactone decarboxylase family protein [Allosphingosinicella sp.]|uniref:carboxymuconolactone decarboxylase family protein n=1 Tax=Allosphingosinicella sp. TaxID=2823234 RepID=UPI003953F047
MNPRLNPYAAAPQTMAAMTALDRAVRESGLDPQLAELVKIRASQINGCAYCIHLHSREALAAGETEERLLLLGAWEDSPLYSERERAALAWTDAVTRLPETGAPDADYAALDRCFGAEEKVTLTVLIGLINAWNRIAVGFRSVHPVGRI